MMNEKGIYDKGQIYSVATLRVLLEPPDPTVKTKFFTYQWLRTTREAGNKQPSASSGQAQGMSGGGCWWSRLPLPRPRNLGHWGRAFEYWDLAPLSYSLPPGLQELSSLLYYKPPPRKHVISDSDTREEGVKSKGEATAFV